MDGGEPGLPVTGLDRPVVVTGAMQPLEAEGSDARDNVELALRFAGQPRLQEVAVAFAGRLMRGVRTRKLHSQAPDAFASPNYPLLGERVGEDAVLYPGRGLEAQQRGAPASNSRTTPRLPRAA